MYKFLLCLRYLRTRYIALASIVSVTLGVATMIVVNSVMAGFSTEMRERIHGILADVIVETNSLEGQPDPERHKAIIQDAVGEYVEAMTATVEIFGLLSFDYQGTPIVRPITLIGAEPTEKAQVSPLIEYLDSYNEVKEGSHVVRAPLRTAGEPIGWELTKDASIYRRRWIARQKWIRQRYRESAPATEEEFNPLANIKAAEGQEPDHISPEQTGPVQDGPAPVGPVEQPLPNDVHVEAADFKTVELPDDETDPTLNGNVFMESKDTEPVDPNAALDGRVYIGLGLVSFPYTVADSNDTKLMMMVRPGDDVKISTVGTGRPPKTVHFNATIVDLFKSGMSEYDSNLVICNLDQLQRVRGMIDPNGRESITSVQIKLKDYADAETVVKRLEEAFPPGVYSVRTWETKQGPLLAAVEVESAILNVLLFLIIAVAGFGILAIFFMIVVEKTRDIGILKALGASSGGVMSIFLSYGLALGLVGAGVGVFTGLLFVKHINTIEKWVTWLTGRKVFDQTIYYFPEIPTSVQTSMVVWVAIGATGIAVLASILPALRASRLDPVEALRYE